jgi:SAM-dependent methyltransferase
MQVTMVSPARWQNAQAYERDYWQSLAARIDNGSVSQLDWYRWRAEQLELRLRSLGLNHLVDGRARVIEVGSGPVGVVGFFPAAKRVAVDPLERSYAANSTLTAHRNPAVDYRQGMVESLPCTSGGYDLAIIENCIDHVRDVQSAMRELRRVLDPRGTLYLTVNCRTSWGYVVHRTLSRLQVDVGHPHTFTTDRLKKLFQDNHFRVLQFEGGAETAVLKTDLAVPGRRLKARVKAAIGMSEFTVSAVAQPAAQD